MEIIIKTEYNRGYKWFILNGIHVKGFLFDKYNHLLKENELIHYFEEVKSLKQFKEKLVSANGQFSVIIHKDDEVFVSVDRTRTFPLFYSLINEKLVISDSALTASDGNHQLSDKSIKEFLNAGYVLGQKSLLSNVFQLISGQFLHYQKKIQISSFFDYKMEKEISPFSSILEKRLKEILDNVGKRLVEILDGRTAVIPLSGGYDSRLIVALLKKNNYKKIICFTYGISSSLEVKTSKKVAKQLNLHWHFIPYNKKLIKGFIETDDFQFYYPFASNYTSSFFTQDYFAVQYLKNEQLVPKNSVFIPGHSGDLLAGGHIPLNLTDKNLVSLILKKHFALRSQHDKKFGIEIEKSFINARPFEEFDNWNFKERQGKFIINSNRVYEFFGYQHLIPIWDNELISFFQNIGLPFKLNQNLYNKVIFQNFFQPANIAFKKTNYPFLIQKMIGIWNRLYRKIANDPTNFKYIAHLFCKNEQLDIKWSNTKVNINTIQSTWYIQKIKKDLE